MTMTGIEAASSIKSLFYKSVFCKNIVVKKSLKYLQMPVKKINCSLDSMHYSHLVNRSYLCTVIFSNNSNKYGL